MMQAIRKLLLAIAAGAAATPDPSIRDDRPAAETTIPCSMRKLEVLIAVTRVPTAPYSEWCGLRYEIALPKRCYFPDVISGHYPSAMIHGLAVWDCPRRFPGLAGILPNVSSGQP